MTDVNVVAAMSLAFLLASYHAESVATNIMSVEYDAETDMLIVAIAYSGTHEDHVFSISWGECRALGGGEFETYGLLSDSAEHDFARQEFTTKLEVDMSSHPCRPATVTIRTPEGFNRSLNIPERKPKEEIEP